MITAIPLGTLKSDIYAHDDLLTGNWAIKIVELRHDFADLHIGFTAGPPVVSFKDLKFGYELREGNDIISYKNWPPSGVKYRRSDQTYLVTHRISFPEPGVSYILHLWAENENKRIEKDFQLQIPQER
jgi:hypothetical protein